MSKISQLYGLSDQEIAHRELILSHKYDVKIQSTETQEVLLKILSAIETDGDLLSDGEVIDMIHNLLNSMGLQELLKEAQTVPEKCKHDSMSGTGEYLKCNNCGYVKITQYHY